MQAFRQIFTRAASLDGGPGSRSGPTSTTDEVDSCTEILKVLDLPNLKLTAADGQKVTKDDKLGTFLTARAGPNQGLARTFGVENSFTTTRPSCHNKFNEEANARIYLSSDDWDIVSHFVSDSLKRTAFNRGKTALVPLIQVTTLKAILPLLFPGELGNTGVFLTEIDQIGEQRLEALARLINELWLATKTSTPAPYMEQTGLREILLALFPKRTNMKGEFSCQRDTNPLNLILPAYETMWRVVLRGYLEVAFRSHVNKESMGLCDLMVHASQTPSVSTKAGETCPKIGDISALMVAKEALRLYPPTRRVYRDVELDYPGAQQSSQTSEAVGQGKSGRLAANIEGLQRKSEYWHPDPLKFDPARWKSIDKQTEIKYFLTFGVRPHKCPAAPSFGPRMVALLVGCLADVYGPKRGWKLDGNDQRGIVEQVEDMNKPLSNNREDYVGLSLVHDT